MATKTSKKVVTSAERRKEALEYRKAGLTFEEIGSRLGVTRQAAHKTVMVALSDISEKIAETADDIRTLELERLNDLFQVSYKAAMRGNLDAIDKCIKIMDRRSKLLGLDAPSKASVEFSRMSDDELATFIRQEITSDSSGDSGSE